MNIGDGKTDSSFGAKLLKMKSEIKLSKSRDDLIHKKYEKIHHFENKNFTKLMESNTNVARSMIFTPPASAAKLFISNEGGHSLAISLIPVICVVRSECRMIPKEKPILSTDSSGSVMIVSSLRVMSCMYVG